MTRNERAAQVALLLVYAAQHNHVFKFIDKIIEGLN